MPRPPRDLAKIVWVASAAPNPISVLSQWFCRSNTDLPEARHEDAGVSRVCSGTRFYHEMLVRQKEIPTLSHSLVEPGTTDLSGWRRTSSLRAVIFIDSNNFSYSPRLGSSPIPTTMIQSAYHICRMSTRTDLTEHRPTNLANARLGPGVCHRGISDVQYDPVFLLQIRKPPSGFEFTNLRKGVFTEVP